MLIGDGEDVPRDKMDGKFFERPEGACVYFQSGRCGIYPKHPFICKAYPFSVVGGTLAKDGWCEQAKDLSTSDLQDIKKWILDNAPPELINFWNGEKV